jgi:diguanylate cyclase (GGDEF)-like protein
MAPPGSDDTARLAALHELRLLDTPPEPGFDQITQLACRLTEAPVSVVSLVDERRVWFKSVAGAERAGLDLGEPGRSGWFCSVVVAEGAPLVVEDATADSRFAGDRLVRSDPGVAFYAGAPLRAPAGAIVGALAVIDVVPRQATDVQLGALRELAKLAEGELSSLQHATTDSLTGVALGRIFERVGNHLLDFTDSRRQPSVVILADFTGLGMVNQLYGYDIGDQALIDSAAVIRQTVRGSDLVARVGPDEFGLFLLGAGVEAVPLLLGRLASRIKSRNDSQSRPYVVSFDYGHAEHRAGDGTDTAALLAAARRQMDERRRSPGFH